MQKQSFCFFLSLFNKNLLTNKSLQRDFIRLNHSAGIYKLIYVCIS